MAVSVDEMLARALRSRFYADRLRGVSGWDTVALTRRQELVRDQLAHPPLGSRRLEGAATPVRAGTSGSGADLLVLAWTEDDLRRERLAGTRALARLGIRAGTVVANTLAGALTTPGSLLLGDDVEELGGLDVPLGTIDGDAGAKAAWELVDRVRPSVLVLEVATGARFFGIGPDGERPWLSGVVWLVRDGTAAPPAISFGGWQKRWLAIPEAASFAAVSCDQGRLHADEDLHVEVVDGEFVVTQRHGSLALVRYATGLRGRLDPACPCGASGAILDLAGT
jgi:hypothetical protein